MLLALIPLAIFFIVLLLIGFILSYKANSSLSFKKEYFLGSQNLGGFVLAMTLVATYGSVSTFISGPGVAWDLGLSWVVFASPQIITAFLILGILGKRMSLLSAKTNSLTLIDLLFVRFKSRLLSIILSLMLLVFFIAMMVGQFIGGAKIFASLINIDYHLALIIFSLVTVLYSSGGFRAVAISDAICAILMLMGMFLLFHLIITQAGGYTNMMSKITSDNAFMSYDAGGKLPLNFLLSAWILVGFATIGLPQSLIRCMSYKSSHEMHKSMLIATIVCGALMIGMTLLGVLAKSVINSVPSNNSDDVIPSLIAHNMHPLLAGITILGPLAATMSTVSSLLIAASSAIVRDLCKALQINHENTNLLNYQERILIKGSTMFIGIIAIILAIFPLDIVVWINLFAFGGLESAFLWIVILGIFAPWFNLSGALISIIFSLISYTVLMYSNIKIFNFHAIVPSLLLGLIGAILGSLIGKYIFKEQLSIEVKNIFFPHK